MQVHIKCTGTILKVYIQNLSLKIHVKHQISNSKPASRNNFTLVKMFPFQIDLTTVPIIYIDPLFVFFIVATNKTCCGYMSDPP